MRQEDEYRTPLSSGRFHLAGARPVVAVLVLITLFSALGIAGASAATSRLLGGQIPLHNLTRASTPRQYHPKTISNEPAKDFNIQGASLTPDQYNSLLDLAQHAGAKVISLDVSWSSYEPNGPASRGEWTQLDPFVNDVLRRGMQLRFQLVGFPDWARDAHDPNSASEHWRAPSSPAELRKWSEFVSRVVEHFGSMVTFYEIWNEENISAFWSQGSSPTGYSRLLETSYVAIKAIDPSAQVMFGGVSRNDVGFVQQTYVAIDRLFPKNAVADNHFFDILGVHPYTGNRSPQSDSPKMIYKDQWGTMDENFLGIELLHKLLVAEGEGWKHLYIGEYGFTTVAWESFGPVPDATRAKYLTEAFSLATKTGYVEGFCWYYTYVTSSNQTSWALLIGTYPNYRPTRTYDALMKVPNG